MATMMGSGMTRGAFHGVLLFFLFSPTSTLGSDHLLTSVVFSVAEGIGATLWAKASGMSPGMARTLLATHDFGAAYGLGFSLLATAKLTDPQVTTGSILAGAILGTVGGFYLSGFRGYSDGDAEAINMAGLVGAYLTVPILAWSNATDPRVLSGTLMAGLTGGLITGDLLLRGKKFNAVQGLLIDLGTLGGALLGAGGARVFNGSQNVILTLAALGAVAGFGVSYAFQTPEAPATKTAMPAVSIRVDPTGLMALASPTGHPQGLRPATLLSLEGRF